MKLLVFGGSFDPVHRGHVAMAEAAQAQWKPDLLAWVPSRQAPHKLDARPAAPEDRADMLRAVMADRGPGEVLRLDEFDRSGPSYSVDTLEHLAAEFPQAELAFLCGGDSLGHLATWRDLPRLFRLARFLFAPREGWGPEREEVFRAELPAALDALLRISWLEMEPVRCSSTAIRAAAAAGEDLGADLPPAVAELVLARGLYRATSA
jgi:nicotinate-nucleotide adenylyltransferase